ncbi:hypothetical protein BXQ17_04305 [Polaribacter sp. BM10]|uniref:hypothetical protein n=1 Tax=Polaribacter sp. BM10 TaxID=1529069 RepID=UPI00098BAE9F|nr:hypothetical protein [Polaribacter sp. BM10]AQS93350.1 hypothetical protein BXQ17_04305 [Polaribacter sp. BM10]
MIKTEKKIEKKEVSKFIFKRNKGIILSLFSCLFFLILASCKAEKGDPDRFKQGVFEIPAGNGYSKTKITRIDSLQIEEYDKIVSISTDSLTTEKRIKHIDTLYIKWKSNFFYSLKMKSPKKQLDKDAIYVQITKIKDSSYDFSAKIGFSKFLTDGTIYKIK